MKRIFAFACALLLAGCTHTTQTTSGAAYLSQYDGVSYRSADTTQVKTIDQRVRDAAAVEPILKFPARIGIARIDQGRLSTIPAGEAEAWQKTEEKLGKGFGEFVPVSPMVAEMVQHDSSVYNRNDTVIDTIRLGAARQHLDAVLIYETVTKESTRDTALTAANVTLIAGWILPSKLHDADGYSNAILIDVIQGYPYGTIQTVVDKKTRISSSWGWGSNPSDTDKFADLIKRQAAVQLSDEAYDMFMKLRAELAEKSAEQKSGK